jgi:hypothetical protein
MYQRCELSRLVRRLRIVEVLVRLAVLRDADRFYEQPKQEFPVHPRIPFAHDVHGGDGLDDAEHEGLRVERSHAPGR